MKLHRIAAGLFLAALVFAMSGKTVHVLFEHHEDELCTESATHFHEKEHSCFICEFDFQLSDGFHFVQPELNLVVLEKEQPCVPTVFVFSLSHIDFTTRGPPVA
ncbi:MAG TPA: hypothetical protein VD905_19515 [Flavobacteriales bacterium]|nr:hypothetical protein [Flavobacteriales bacterium]